MIDPIAQQAANGHANGAVGQSPTDQAPDHERADEQLDQLIAKAHALVTLSQGNVEAMVQSGQVWAGGFQDMYKVFAASAQAQLDQSLFVWKALSETKSLGAAIALQSKLARHAFDAAILETVRAADASVALTQKAMAPLAARTTLILDTSSAASWPRPA